MVHALVLVKAEREALAELGGRLAELDGVAVVYSVTGDWDFVALLRLREHEELATMVTRQLAAVPGIANTHTMVAFTMISQHDMDAMFSIGA